MTPVYKTKKGLDLRLEGAATQTLRQIPLAAEYAIRPADFHGLSPRLAVREGDHVVAGAPLFTDKATGRICITAPVSGTVKQIERGERRKILNIRITPDANQEAKTWSPLSADADRTAVVERLLETGLFAFFRQRPYDVIASPEDTPKAIFVSAFSKMPLAADFSFVAQGEEETFRKGIEVLAKIAPVHLGLSKEQSDRGAFAQLADNAESRIKVGVFDGPNPSGNVGVQINHVCPVNKGEVVWTMAPQHVLFVGRLATTGKADFRVRIAVGGSEVKAPHYAETLLGTPLSALVSAADHTRIINGNPLVGQKAAQGDFLSAFAAEVCVLPEGDDVHEAFGWILPRLKQHSTSRSYFSWLMPRKLFAPDCRIKGGQRHMIMSGEYDRVFPMDIFAGYLVKAIITGDIDRQEALGIYEVAPEDFAVAEYVDSSKLELQRIVREGLDILRKENA